MRVNELVDFFGTLDDEHRPTLLFFDDDDPDPEETAQAQIKEIAEHIHYPTRWDTTTYPTLLSAIKELDCCKPDYCARPEKETVTKTR